MSDPFRVTGPALISFSGGRTSGYMLWRIIQAHHGVLPDDVVVCFANTGREMPGTLDFVRDCAAAWNVVVHWLEYRHEPGRNFFEEVSHNSAARNGEPFEALIAAKSYLPSPVYRFCTTELKVRTMRRYVRETYGWRTFLNVVGLRADEGRRVENIMDPEKQAKDGFITVCPLAEAGISQSDVFAFWRAQPFDLRLKGPWEGNCDGCFLKNRHGIERMLKDHPERMQWWEDQETAAASRPNVGRNGARFRIDRENVAAMARTVRDQGYLPFDIDEPVLPCDQAACGV